MTIDKKVLRELCDRSIVSDARWYEESMLEIALEDVGLSDETMKADVAYMVAANPQTIRALLDENERLHRSLSSAVIALAHAAEKDSTYQRPYDAARQALGETP